MMAKPDGVVRFRADADGRRRFELAYAVASGMSVELLRQYRVPVPCDCGHELCEGWQMVPLGVS
jgi:hypothetical protein